MAVNGGTFTRAGFDFGYGPSYEEARKRHNKQWEILGDEAAAVDLNKTLVGSIVRFQVADGYACYYVSADEPLTLQLVPSGDCWTIPEAHLRGLNRADVLKLAQAERAMRQAVERRVAESFPENLYTLRLVRNKQYPNVTDPAVFVNGQPLDLRLDLANHSPTGFNWGYQGSGPSQTALAILAHEKGDEFALQWYQTFKREVIAALPMDREHEIRSAAIRHWFDKAHAGQE